MAVVWPGSITVSSRCFRGLLLPRVGWVPEQAVGRKRGGLRLIRSVGSETRGSFHSSPRTGISLSLCCKGVVRRSAAAMRRRGPGLTALLLAAQIVSLCLLVADADALVRPAAATGSHAAFSTLPAEAVALPYCRDHSTVMAQDGPLVVLHSL